MPFDLWLSFMAASTLLLLIPGPTVVLVLSYALTRGRSVALTTAAGVAAGDALAMTASLAGLGAVVLASAAAFTVLKWIGAAYLVWLGLRMLRSAGAAPDPGVRQTRGRGTFRHAAAVTALNPKSIAFFIAFVPQFVTPDAPLVPQFAVMVVTFVALATTNALAWALLADRLRARIAGPRVLRALTRTGGCALIAMGAATAMLRRAA